ncbi:unnamed protein product [Fusarium graminearum]|nr:hypothetical protein FG05_35006 [Fusarium graminearum]CZS85894.1 unnamed protein product [Fusarium graminearum]
MEVPMKIHFARFSLLAGYSDITPSEPIVYNSEGGLERQAEICWSDEKCRVRSLVSYCQAQSDGSRNQCLLGYNQF